MTSRSRESLKRYFRDGALPNEDHFADLIDSMLNMSDEGFRKTVEHGFEVYSPQGHDALVSFFREQEPETPAWYFELGGARDALLVHGRTPPSDAGQPGAPSGANASSVAPALLCLDQERRIGIGTVPAWPAMPCSSTASRVAPAMAVTTPTGRSCASSTGPCSICSSR